MAASTLSPPNRRDPPESLLIRTAQVGTGVLNTIRVPGDPFEDKRKSWFKKEFDSGNEKKEMPTIHEGNEVKYLIDGKEALRKWSQPFVQPREYRRLVKRQITSFIS